MVKKALTRAFLIAALFSLQALTGYARAEKGGMVTITGTVDKGIIGYVIVTEHGDYFIPGPDLPRELLGKEVTATGTITDKADVRVMDLETIGQTPPPRVHEESALRRIPLP